MTDSTDVAVLGTNAVQNAIAGLNSGAGFFSTVNGEDFDSRLRTTIALTSSLPLEENLGKTINLMDIVVQPVELTSRETGEINTAPRVVLIDADGTAYHGTSDGLLSSVRNIIAGMGNLFGRKSIPIQVVKQKGNNGFSFFTIKILPPAK